MVSLNLLRTFLAVARAGSVGEAAESLAVSQPAVSAALAALAREYGTPLVEREGRGTRLTPAGEALAHQARRIFALLDETRRETTRAANRAARRLRLASVTTVAEQVIAELLRGFRMREPEIDVELFVADRTTVWERLEHWEADLAVGGRPPAEPIFQTLAMRSNALIPVAAAGFDGSYSQATWLLREPGSGTRIATETFLAALGIDPPTLTIGSDGAIRACVRAGLGLSLLSRATVQRDLEDRAIVELAMPLGPIVRNWHLVGPSDRELPDTARRFLAYALESGTFNPLVDAREVVAL
jgi:DNA-binding transcriptional LysR family regulator